MLDSNTHRLLKRQIANADFTPEELERFKSFFKVVNDAYNSFDNDLNHIEGIMEKSSKELFNLNKTLKSQVDNVENKINTIVNTIDGVIFRTDLAGNFKYLNKGWEDLFGVPVEMALGKNYKSLLAGINEKEKKNLGQFLKERREDYKTLFKYYRPDGEKIWVQLRLVLIFNNEGDVTGTIGTMTDVTQLKETEIELNKANKTKDEFLSTMSHEIRTPLNAVIGMVDVLLMDNYLPSQLESLQVLKYSGEHLLALINNLLDLNKYKSEEIEIVEKDFNLPELLQSIKLHFKQKAESKDLYFKTEFDDNIQNVLIGDSLKLSQVLKNLLSNAFKFTHVGGISFSVQVIKTDLNVSTLRFSVEDTGIGVSYNKQKDIFKSFVQASDTTSKLYGGTGLGLYISKELLKIQNSKLNLKSKKGEGSTFWFDITLKHSPNSSLNNERYIAKTKSINLKVLVAEDNRLNALLIRKLFNKWNIDYSLAKNGQEVLDICAKDDFNLILMDLQMPIMDGFEATRAIRKMNDTGKSLIPIIALTAFSKSEVSSKIERYKMNGYLSKPIDVNKLHNLLSFYSKKIQQVV